MISSKFKALCRLLLLVPISDWASRGPCDVAPIWLLKSLRAEILFDVPLAPMAFAEGGYL